MAYKVYFHNKPSTTVDYDNLFKGLSYEIEKEFVTFYVEVMDKHYNVCSYCASEVSKVEIVKKVLSTKETRELKLKKILKKDNIFKRFIKKLKNK